MHEIKAVKQGNATFNLIKAVAQKAYAELPKSTTSDTKVWIGLNVELNDKKHITGFTWLDNVGVFSSFLSQNFSFKMSRK